VVVYNDGVTTSGGGSDISSSRWSRPEASTVVPTYVLLNPTDPGYPRSFSAHITWYSVEPGKTRPIEPRSLTVCFVYVGLSPDPSV
jgi:hypothetical protein